MNSVRKSTSSGLVYSTEHGRMCPTCRKPVKDCACSRQSTPSRSDGIVRIRLETRGRGGKGVTVITGVPLNESELVKYAKQLKQRCGTGGTVKNDTIEIQGDHRDLIMSELTKMGWIVKKSGG